MKSICYKSVEQWLALVKPVFDYDGGSTLLGKPAGAAVLYLHFKNPFSYPSPSDIKGLAVFMGGAAVIFNFLPSSHYNP